MSCFKRRTPFYEHLRHQLGKQQEIGALPYSPILRVYDNKYYFVEESRSTERTFDVVVPLKGSQTTKAGRESSIAVNTSERATKATTVQPTTHTSIITQDYNTAFNSIHCQPFVACCCAYPNCELPSINQRNFGSTYDTERTYFQQLQALNSLLLPNVARMAYEREKLNVEYSTKDYDPSMASKRGKFLFSANSGKEFGKVSETNPEHNLENIRDEKSPFLQAWSTRKNFKTEKSISKKIQSINLEQKRKLDSCESETEEDRDKKRFKSEPNENTTKGAWLEFRPNVDIEKPFNYSKFKKDFSTTSDGVNIRVAKERDVLALQSKDNTSKRVGYETKSTASSSSESHKRHESRVGEMATRHHAGPVSPAARYTYGLELNRNNASHTNCGQQQQQSGNEFISLDSTKSSFLTQMRKIRDEPKNDVIPCPYCCQTFTKYPDLKTHVQTHRDTRTSAGHNVSDVGGQKDNNWLSCCSGSSTKTPHFPVVVQGSTDDSEAKKRPTSVIKFAGQNK